MTIDQQQVNVPELQRLNEAILLTMDAIRRVAPQLAQVPVSPLGMGGPAIDPVTAAWVQGQTQALRAIYGQGQTWGQPWGMPFGQTAQHPLQHLIAQHLLQQQMLGQQPFATSPFGGVTGGQYPQAFGQQAFGQQPFGQQAFGQQPFGQQPFAHFGGQVPWQTPYAVPFGGQFSVGPQYPSPVSYGGIGAQRPF